MSQSDDLEYYRHRVAIERKRPRLAPSKLIADTHAKLAELHQAVIDGKGINTVFPRPRDPMR